MVRIICQTQIKYDTEVEYSIDTLEILTLAADGRSGTAKYRVIDAYGDDVVVLERDFSYVYKTNGNLADYEWGEPQAILVDTKGEVVTNPDNTISYNGPTNQYSEDADGNPLGYDFVYVHGSLANDVANAFEGEPESEWLTDRNLVEGYAGVRAAADHKVVLFNRDANADGAEAVLDVFFHVGREGDGPPRATNVISDDPVEIAVKRADFLSEADLDAGWRFVERDDNGHPTRMETTQNNTTLPQTHAQDVDTALVLAMESDPAIKDWFRAFGNGDGTFTAPGVLGRHEWDPEQLSLGLVAQGAVDIQGQEKTAHVKLIADPFDADADDQPITLLADGSIQVTLSALPDNWQIGDEVVLTSPKLSARPGRDEDSDKELFDFQTTIVSIDGQNVVVEGGADIANFALDPIAHQGIQLTLGNLSRSVTFRSDADEFRSTYWAGGEGLDATYQKDQFGSIGEATTETTVAELGHIMIMHQSGAQILNAEMVNLGRTDKSGLIDDFQASTELGSGGERAGEDIPYLLRDEGNLSADAENILNMRGRYAVHLHQTEGSEDVTDDTVLSGNVVKGGAGWGFVQHGSEAYLFNNIAYDVYGAGFVAETGDETGIWAGNLAVHMDGAAEEFKGLDEHLVKTNDVARDGEGFWMEGRAIALFGNTAANVTGDAFAFESFGSDQVPIDSAVFDYYQIAFDQYQAELAELGYAPSAFDGLSDIHAADGALGHNAFAPIRFFEDNEAFAASRAALSIVNTNIHGQRKFNDAWSVIDGFTSVNSHTGVFQLYASKYLYNSVKLLNDAATEGIIRDEGGNEFAMTLQASSAEAIWIDPTIIGYDLNDQMAHSTRTGSQITGFGKQFNPEVSYEKMVTLDGTATYGIAALSEAWEGLINWDFDGDGIEDGLNAYHNFFGLNLINSTGDAFPDFNPRQGSDQYIWAAQYAGADVAPQYIEGTEGNDVTIAGGTVVENVKYWRTTGSEGVAGDPAYQEITLPTEADVSISLIGTSADEGIVALDRMYMNRTDWEGSTDEVRIRSSTEIGKFDKLGVTTATDDLRARNDLNNDSDPGNDVLPILFGTQEWDQNEFFIHAHANARLEDEKGVRLGEFGDDQPYTRGIYSGAVVEFDKTDSLGTSRYYYDDFVVLRNSDSGGDYTTPQKNFVDMNGDGIIDAMVDDATYDAYVWDDGRKWSDQNTEASRVALLKTFDSYHAVTTQTTNERMIIDEAMVEKALSEVGYFVAPGVTYTDAAGVERDMKFVQVPMLFVDRGTGDFVRKFATVALDETWPTDPEQYQGILGANGIDDEHIVAEHYGHFREGKKVWIADAHEVLDVTAGVNLAHEGDDVISAANIAEAYHRTVLTVDLGDGNDTFVALAGHEAVDGGSGQDTVTYADSDAAVSANLDGSVGIGGTAEGDTINDVETLIGSNFDDNLAGHGADETLVGGAGSDTLTGHDGADVFVIAAGTGTDTITDFATSVDKIDISAWSAEVLSDLTFTNVSGILQVSDGANALNLLGYTQADQGAFSASDFGLAVSPAILLGTDAADTINADYFDVNNNSINDDGQTILAEGGNDVVFDGAGDDTVFGGSGNDRFYGGAGADAYDGGADKHDRIYYDRSDIGLTIDLTSPGSSTGIALGDTLTGVEYVYGSDHADTIIGNDEVFKIFGGDGDDHIISGTRNHILDGGLGSDTFFFNVGSGDDKIRNFNIAEDKVDVSNWGVESLADLNATQSGNNVLLSYGDDSILLTNISVLDVTENNVVHLNTVDPTFLLGTDGNDTIDETFIDVNTNTINDNGQTIEAGDGDDRIYDGAGDDEIFGGAGRDRFYAGEGANSYDGGEGKHDTVYYDRATGDIVVDLLDSTNNEGIAAGDTYTMIEAIFGSSHNDTIIGDGIVFKLYGRGGDDDITSGSRRNIIDVGSGDNIVRLIDDTGYDRIKSFDVNDDRLDVTAWGATSFGELSFDNQTGYTDLYYDDERIRLDGVSGVDFTSDNFLF